MNDFMKRFTGASDDPAQEERLAHILRHLYKLYHTEIDLSLDRTYRFLSKLGNPHLRLPPTVHVAGTNGKGSTVASLYALLRAAGQSVHVYTSPHLVHATERVRLANRPIPTKALCDLLTECIEINGSEPITFFEMFTAAALLGFSRAPADWLILEVGMGGRLDATNVIPAPAATIITTISYDHQNFLGNTLPLIAKEKAGIMKAGVPCIIGRQTEEALADGVMDVFQKQSSSLSPAAPLHVYGADWCTAPESDLMLFRFGADSIRLPKPCLCGSHQLWNAGAALAAFRVIAPEHFRPEILSTAMGQIEWPGRLQTLENHPFQKLVPDGWKIVIDGGHNDSAGEVLGQQAAAWAAADGKPLHLIVAMVNRKDPIAFLKPLQPYAASVTFCPIAGESTAFAPETLANIAHRLDFKGIYTAENPHIALKSLVAQQTNTSRARILFTGSLFFMGNLLRFL